MSNESDETGPWGRVVGPDDRGRPGEWPPSEDITGALVLPSGSTSIRSTSFEDGDTGSSVEGGPVGPETTGRGTPRSSSFVCVHFELVCEGAEV